jgi:UPF0176 protein
VNNYYVTAFYKFMPLSFESLLDLKALLQKTAERHQILGLIVLGPEGINSTLSASSLEDLAAFKTLLLNALNLTEMNFKDSLSHKAPFRRFVIKSREEIVTLGTPELVPLESKNHHLSPSAWNQVLKNDDDYVLIDTRNWYEFNLGSFRGAINPDIEKFTDFPKYLEQQNISKDKKMLIFCTGGIRCEKGILELQRQGYDQVYQLEGGILKYLEEYPHDQFAGECFVFDHRVALDQQLEPSTKYGLCPHCGQPSHIEISCQRCEQVTLICPDCAELDFKKVTCSKNCSYHLKLHPDRKVKSKKLDLPENGHFQRENLTQDKPPIKTAVGECK